MSKRPTLCRDGHQIEWLTEVVGVCEDFEWLWDSEWEEGGRLRRVYSTPITDGLVVALRETRSQLASATATIAEQTRWAEIREIRIVDTIARAIAAEGREAQFRLALEQIREEAGRKTCGEDSCDRALCRVHFKGWELATAALATPANGAGEVLMAAVALNKLFDSYEGKPVTDESIHEHAQAVRLVIAKTAAWQKREGETDG